ncbi:MAG: hypothetical protein ACR5LG_06555 [Sodalis sp. (in: enterobacteria)]|uniref:hypothetical protein n=1 Tax=Sodalis sp. (in: enterobacteria) TaxID=1898979 RepID=UPI003F3520E6
MCHYTGQGHHQTDHHGSKQEHGGNVVMLQDKSQRQRTRQQDQLLEKNRQSFHE